MILAPPVTCSWPGAGSPAAPPAATVALDAGLVAAAQAVEHYEIARYGTLRTWANQLGLSNAVALCEATLQEEIATDQALSQVAEAEANVKAA